MPQPAPDGSIYSPPGSSSILSFHGGGFRGYFSALVANGLATRKSTLGDFRPLGQSFDLICGTSVGSIIAAALASEIPLTKVVRLFEEHGEAIFPERPFLKTKPGFWRSRFGSEKLRELLTEVLNKKKLGDLDRALLIPAVNETKGQPTVFRSYDPRQEEIKLVDAVMASAAAPLYLPLHRINGERYADGGIIANGPELIAASDLVSKFDVPVGNQRILSVGTIAVAARSEVPLSTNDRWGAMGWIFKHDRLRPLMMEGQVAVQRELLKSLGPRQQFHLDINLPPEQEKHIHIVLANGNARLVLEQAAESCLAHVPSESRSQLDSILSRVARRVAYFRYPGSSSIRPGFCA